MSAAIFDAVHVVKNDRSITGVTQLPTVSELRRQALAAPFVLRYETNDVDVSGTYDIHKLASTRAGPAETVAVTTAPGTLSPAVAAAVEAVLEQRWPSSLQEWPLCEVSRLWLARPATRRTPSSSLSSASSSSAAVSATGAAGGYGEMLCTSRWEVMGTVFALERYQLVRVPLRTEAAWRRWQEATTATTTKTTTANAVVIVCGDGLRDASASGPAAHALSSSRNGAAVALRSSSVGRCPLESVEQASQAVVDCTVCRVLSTAEGEPPVPHVAAQRLLGLTDAALRECFFGTCVPLLGVTQDDRRARWQKIQLDHELNRSFSPCSMTEVDNSGLHESGSAATGCGGTASYSSVAHGHVSFSTDASELTVRWDGAAAEQTPLQNRYDRRDNNGARDAQTHRGSGLTTTATTSSSPASHEEPWQPFAVGRSNHVVWQLTAMPSLFDAQYFAQSGDGWRRWRDVCGGGINRNLIVNSIDEIVDYCACSRRAFYAAVAYLDRFVAMATDPAENCRAFLISIGAPDSIAINMDRIVTFFTQVITVCAMLGCKNTDLYPPHVNKVLLCLKPTMRLTLSDFDALELHILATLHFDVQPVTLDAAVDLLLYACGTDQFQERTVDVKHYYTLFDTVRSGEQYLKEEFDQRMTKAASSMDARRRRQEELREALCRGSALHDVSPSASTAQPDTPPDVWEDFGQFARFLCDQLIRGSKGPTSSPNPEGGQSQQQQEAMATLEGYLWALPPTLLGTAIIIVTAEMFDVPLPAPLFWLLPETYKHGLCDKGLSPVLDAITASLAAVTRVHVDDDDTRILLKYFVTLFHRAATALASSSPQLASAAEGVDGSQEVVRSAIGVVQSVYQQCRATQCDKLLLKRYQTLFKRLNPAS